MAAPRGEIREALCKAYSSVPEELGATWRDVAAASQVGFQAAKRAVENMVKWGELEVVRDVRVPGCRRPMKAYRLKQRSTNGFSADSTAAIGDIMKRWRT